ncbi:MAG: hypothetical protein QNK04_13360 [Myxococcota bacterium]|nr:hypothetical protein [Myxococcota bacterium]
MSEPVTPLVTFETLTNTELGARSIRVNGDGSVSLVGVVKKVTESMLTSYPRTQLGTWTPNRASLRYDRDEIAKRRVKRFESGEALDLEGILALAS